MHAQNQTWQSETEKKKKKKKSKTNLEREGTAAVSAHLHAGAASIGAMSTRADHADSRDSTRAADQSAIPRVLHRMWFDPQHPDRALPPHRASLYNRYIASWHKYHPHWRHVFWTGRSVLRLWASEPRLARWRDFFLRGIERHIERCDFTRYAILWLLGGVYVDLDFLCMRCIDPLLLPHASPLRHGSFSSAMDGSCWRVLGLLRDIDLNRVAGVDGRVKKMFNGFMMSMAGHPFWPGLMDEIMHAYVSGGDVMLNTGPTRLALYADRIGVSECATPQHFIDKCLIIPMQAPSTPTAECVGTAAVQRPFCATLWTEGSGWNFGVKIDSMWREAGGMQQMLLRVGRGASTATVHDDLDTQPTRFAPCWLSRSHGVVCDARASAPTPAHTLTPATAAVCTAVLLAVVVAVATAAALFFYFAHARVHGE